MKRIFTVCVLVILLFVQQIAFCQQTTVKIGVLNHYSNEEFSFFWQSTVQHLSSSLPEYQFELIPLEFGNISEAVKNNRIDFLICNPFQYVDLAADYRVNSIATMRTNNYGMVSSSYGSVIFTRNDNQKVYTLSDLKGKKVTAVDSTSLGGWLAAWRELKDAGINPYEDFSNLTFAGQHAKVVEMVLTGQTDVGIVRTGVLEKLAAEQAINVNNIRVIEVNKNYAHPYFLTSTRSYPEWPFAKLVHVPDDLANKVAIALLQMNGTDMSTNNDKYVGWSYPLDYYPVHELQMELKTGYFKDFGKTNFGNFYDKYRVGIISGVLLVCCLLVAFLVAMYWNKRLQRMQKELDSELARRKKSEEILKEEETRLLQAQTIGNIGSWELDLATKTVWGSDEAFRIYGIENVSSYMSLDVVQKISLVEDRVQMDLALKSIIEENIPYDLEYRIQRVSDGQLRYIQSKADLFFDEKGKPRKVVGIIQDITEQKRLGEQLRQKEARFRTIFNTTNVGISIIHEDNGKYKMANARWCEMLGYKEEEILQLTVDDITHPDDLSETHTLMNKLLCGEIREYNQQKQYLRKDGSIFWGDMHVTSWSNEQGDIEFLVGTIVDITERKLAEQKIQASEERFRLIAETCPVPLMLTRPSDAKVLYMNQRFAELFKVPRDFAESNCVSKYYANLHERECVLQELSQKGTVRDREILLKKYDGETFWALLSITLSRYQDESVCIVGVNDISQSKALEKELVQRATTDGLTGVANRAYFIDIGTIEFQRARRYGHALAVMIMDIDYFKNVNDTYGHHAGDEVLKAFAQLALANVRSSDTVGRIGGEEFAVILPETDIAAALVVAEKIRQQFEGHTVTAETDDVIQRTVSIGITLMQDIDETFECMQRRADQQLYVAKNAGRNCVRVG